MNDLQAYMREMQERNENDRKALRKLEEENERLRGGIDEVILRAGPDGPKPGSLAEDMCIDLQALLLEGRPE